MTNIAHKGEGHRQRLKQKFFAGGLDGFLDYEVIELLLILNTPRKDCKDSAKELLKNFKTLQSVFEAEPEELQKVKGVGKANVLGLKLIKAVAERYLEKRIIAKDVVKNPEDLIKYLQHSIGNKEKEYFAGIFLDAKNRVLASEILFTGSLTSSSVYPREVIIKALHHKAATIIFAHNHPSGDVSPSSSDIAITRRLVFALSYVGIVVHEHLITGSDGFYSFHENGYIDKFKKEYESNNG
ncbi:MAG: DNA repair protein RadC [Desulfobacteraceae bacterium]|nr:DNA repair protein RadC [Desulfobacteraceae bacterium]